MKYNVKKKKEKRKKKQLKIHDLFSFLEREK